MNPAASLSRDLLRDSESTLRIVDSLLHELRDAEPATPFEGGHALAQLDELNARRTGLAALPPALLHACADISAALEMLRVSRSTLGRATLERVRRTQEQLHEAAAVMEVAAVDPGDARPRHAGVALGDSGCTAGALAALLPHPGPRLSGPERRVRPVLLRAVR